MLWDPATGRHVATLTGHSSRVETVRFSPDGKTLASRGIEGLVQLWHVATREQVGTLRVPQGLSGSMEFSPDGSLLAAAGTDGTIRLWRAAPFSSRTPRRGTRHWPWTGGVEGLDGPGAV